MSKISEEILKQIQAEIDRRGIGFDSLDELNKIAAEVTARYNRTAIADFEGLSPEQMHAFDCKQFAPECPVRFKKVINPDIIAASPVMEACWMILNAIRADNGLKLTVKGNLPRKVVNEIFNAYIYKELKDNDYYPKVLNELDYYPAAVINALLKVAGITKVSKNKLHFTRNGTTIARDEVQLFQTLCKTYTSRYNKGYLDNYGDTEIGNHGLLFVIYLLHRYGREKREEDFYARLYFKAFPHLINEIRKPLYATPEQMAFHCFTYRVFDKGLYLFGLIDIEYTGKDIFTRKTLVKTTELFRQVFDID
jgi:hypothetical protein